jgi:hypothetical protein
MLSAAGDAKPGFMGMCAPDRIVQILCIFWVQTSGELEYPVEQQNTA